MYVATFNVGQGGPYIPDPEAPFCRPPPFVIIEHFERAMKDIKDPFGQQF